MLILEKISKFQTPTRINSIEGTDLSSDEKEKMRKMIEEHGVAPGAWGDGKTVLWKKKPENFKSLKTLSEKLLESNDEKELDEAVLEYAKAPVKQMRKPSRLSTLLYCLQPRHFAVVNHPVERFLKLILKNGEKFKVDNLQLEKYVDLNKLLRQFLKDWDVGKEFGMLDSIIGSCNIKSPVDETSLG